MKKYLVTFRIEGVEKKDIIEVVEIVATDEVVAQNGAFKTTILSKYKGRGGRYIVIDTMELENV